MKIVFCPWRQLAQRVAGEEAHTAAVLSSSTEPEASRLPKISYVFRQYEDIDVPIPGRSFSQEDARAFGDFIRGLDRSVDTLYCCCDAAKSRSPAVAAAACRYFGQDDSHIWGDPFVQPNMLVFDLLTTALGVPVADGEKDALLHQNRMALRTAIRSGGQ